MNETSPWHSSILLLCGQKRGLWARSTCRSLGFWLHSISEAWLLWLTCFVRMANYFLLPWLALMLTDVTLTTALSSCKLDWERSLGKIKSKEYSIIATVWLLRNMIQKLPLWSFWAQPPCGQQLRVGWFSGLQIQKHPCCSQAIKTQSFVLCKVQAFVRLSGEFSEEQCSCCEDFYEDHYASTGESKERIMHSAEKWCEHCNRLELASYWGSHWHKAVTGTKGPSEKKSSNFGFTQ